MFTTTIDSTHIRTSIVVLIINMLIKCSSSGWTWIESIVFDLVQNKTPAKSLILSAVTIAVKCLRIQNILQLCTIFNHGSSCLICLKMDICAVWIYVCVHMDYLRIWNSRNVWKKSMKMVHAVVVTLGFNWTFVHTGWWEKLLYFLK